MTPTWNWPIPYRLHNRADLLVHCITSETLSSPPSAQEFNLHYVCTVRSEVVFGHPKALPFVLTIAVPINAEDDSAHESTGSPALEEKLDGFLTYGQERTVGPLCRKGLYSDIFPHSDQIDILVTPLDDFFLEGRREPLWMFVSYKGLNDCSETIDMDMDEATGRVVIWGWEESAHETKVFIGDLV